MMKRILVPLDGSARAEHAIPLAAHLVHASGGKLILLRVIGSPVELCPSTCPPLPSAAVQTMLEVDRTEAMHYLQAVARSHHLEESEWTSEVLAGPVASTILSVVVSCRADFMLMCRRSTGSSRWGLGSVAEKAIRHAPVPVLVLPAGEAGEELGASQRPRRALVALDGSAAAEAALVPASRLIAALASPAQGALHLALVVKMTPAAGRGSGHTPVDSGMRASVYREAGMYIWSVAERLRKDAVAAHLLVSWSILFADDVAEALIRLAEKGEGMEHESVPGRSGCDLIVMSTHGRGGVQAWSMGSVTARVLGATRLPLLIVQPAKSGGSFRHGPMPSQEDALHVGTAEQEPERMG